MQVHGGPAADLHQHKPISVIEALVPEPSAATASSGALARAKRWGRGRDNADGGAQKDVVGPPPGELFSETNDNSVALLLTYGTARILLAGDAEAREEEYMAFGPYTGPLTVLKVTHHGSSTSSTPLFLSRFPPKVAVIQVGADNPYGHPTPETLERLQRTGARVFRNDEHGDVIVTIKEEEVDVAVTRPGTRF